MTGHRLEPFAHIATPQFVYAANAPDLALQRNQRQQSAQLADVEVLLQGCLHRIVNQFVLDQARIRLANIDLARDLRQVAFIQPFGDRLRRVESKRCLIRRGVLNGVFAERFGMNIERVGQRQTT